MDLVNIKETIGINLHMVVKLNFQKPKATANKQTHCGWFNIKHDSDHENDNFYSKSHSML